MTPKVSVIMPSFNVKKYIKECMESVKNQTLKDIEIICVDALSTDGTLEILQEYVSKDKRIKIIKSEKKSYGYQMNIGIEEAKGEYIGILETDDFIDRDMFEELYRIAKQNDLDFIREDFNNYIGEENEKHYFKIPICSKPEYYEKILLNKQKEVIKTTQTIIWSGLYKKSFLTKNKVKFNETSGASYQDNGFWFITSSLASRVLFHKNSHYNYRRDNPESSVVSKEKEYCIYNEYEYILDFLKKDELMYKKFINLYWYVLFRNYLFTLKRIGEPQKEEFLLIFRRKLNEGLSKQEIDLKLFNCYEKNLLNKILYKPNKVRIKKLELRPINIKEASYLQRLLYCYEDNGLMYTINHIIERIASYFNKRGKE